jgi:pantothenate kinase-related protein Tda10
MQVLASMVLLEGGQHGCGSGMPHTEKGSISCLWLQEEQLHAVRDCLEAVLQLLSRVSSLGPIEAFFAADELAAHYQWRLNATHALLCR